MTNVNCKQPKSSQKGEGGPKEPVFILASSDRGTEDPFKILSRLEEETGKALKDLRLVIIN